MRRTAHLPNFEHMSVLIAVILLAYAVARLINLPGQVFPVQFAGVYLAFQLNAKNIIAFAVAGLTAAGTDWLLLDHPDIGDRATIAHWILPGLTAWVITVPLNYLPVSPLWWAAFALGGALLVLVILAEYIAIDPQDFRYFGAALGLTTLSFALFLVLAISMRSVGLRLIFSVPPLGLSAALVSLRVMHLRLGRWQYVAAVLIGLVIAQLAAALHYLPLSPAAFGLLLLGPAYAIPHLIINLYQENSLRQAVLEPAVILAFMVFMAIWLD